MEKRPADIKSACVARVVCPEDNEEGGTGWSNLQHAFSTEPAEWRWVGAGAVVQWHAVITTVTMRFQAEFIER